MTSLTCNNLLLAGVPTATVLWYYCEDQVKADRLSINPPIATRELLASRHLDVIPLDTIDEIIRVLTYNEYARCCFGTYTNLEV